MTGTTPGSSRGELRPLALARAAESLYRGLNGVAG